MRVGIVAALTLVPLAARGGGAEPRLHFDRLGPRDGLPGDAVSAIAQDALGFVWIGTTHGLARYDGHRVHVFQHVPGDPRTLASPAVTALAVDRRGVVWAGGSTGDLSGFDQHEGTFQRYPPPQGALRPISRLLVDRGGELWVAIDGGGVWRFDPVEGRYAERVAGAPDDPIELFEDRHGGIWIGARSSGAARWDPEARTLRVYRSDPAAQDGLRNDHIGAIAEDAGGDVWLGSSGGGLARIDIRAGGAEARAVHAPGALLWVNRLLLQDDGTFWVGTETDGLVRYDPRSGAVTRHALPDGHFAVRALLQDAAGVVWLAPALGEVLRFPAWTARLARYAHDPANPNSPTAGHALGFLEAPGGVVWIAGSDGLDRFDRRRGVFTRYKPDADPKDSPRNVIIGLARDEASGHLWLCAHGTGLKRFDPESGTFTHFRHDPADPRSLGSDACRAIAIQGRDLWIGHESGLDRFDLDGLAIAAHHAVGPVWAVAAAPNAREVWAAGPSGLSRLDDAAGRVAPFAQVSLHPGGVASLALDRSGALWIGMAAEPVLSRLDPASGTASHFRPLGDAGALQGDLRLAPHAIAGIAEAEGALWLATRAGLVRFDPTSGEAVQYRAGPGAARSRYHALHLGPSGDLYLGGVTGFTIFSPREPLEIPPRSAKVSLLQGARVLADRAALALDHDERLLSFELTAFPYWGDAPRYEYRLDGLHDEWVETREPAVVFAGLPPGSYTFTARAGDAVSAPVRIEVLPPPWRTWWAYSIYAAVAVALAIGALRSVEHRRERARLSRWTAELERRVTEAKREVRETEEALIRLSQLARFGEFAASVAHDLKTPLTFIRGELELLEEARAAGRADDALIAETIASLLEHCRRMRAEIETAMGYASPGPASPEPIALGELCAEIAKMLRGRAEQSGVVLRLEIPRELELETCRAELRHVLANLLANAIEATPSGGEVVVFASRGEAGCEIRVRDTGPGIAEEIRARLFQPFASTKGDNGTGLGLASCRRIVEEVIGGEIALERPGPGDTTFLIRLP